VTLRWRAIDEGAAAFEVEDTGIGIAPDHIPRSPSVSTAWIAGARGNRRHGAGPRDREARAAAPRRGAADRESTGKGSVFSARFAPPLRRSTSCGSDAHAIAVASRRYSMWLAAIAPG
jgi:hypothetical protein